MANETAFSVGEYLRDELKERGWTTRDCAERMAALGGDDAAVWELTLDLHIAVCNAPDGHAIHQGYMGRATAEALESVMGISADTWMRLDAAYREAVEREEA